MESRVILPVEMSVENHYGFVVCAMAGFERQPVFTPGNRRGCGRRDRHFVADPNKQ
jgi:hypothetical protein